MDKQIIEINEQIKKAIQRIENIGKKYDELREKYKAKEQECKNLREDIKDIANLLDLDTDEEYNFSNIELEIKQLKAENEKLKEQLTILDDEDVVVEITVEQFEEYKKLKAENEELKQALKEIKEIAKNGCYDDCNMPLDELVIILQKISEVIDD